MWCRSGNGKNCKHRKYECLIPFMQCGSGTTSGDIVEYFSAPWSDSCRCCRASAVESGRGLHSRRFFFVFVLFCYIGLFIKSYQSFKDAGNCNEGQLGKTELKLWEVVIGIMFRPLFYGIWQPKALLSFGSSLFFFLVEEV